MTDPVVRARLAVLKERLSQPTPAPLEGQETIDVDEDPDHAEGPSMRPCQPSLW